MLLDFIGVRNTSPLLSSLPSPAQNQPDPFVSNSCCLSSLSPPPSVQEHFQINSSISTLFQRSSHASHLCLTVLSSSGSLAAPDKGSDSSDNKREVWPQRCQSWRCLAQGAVSPADVAGMAGELSSVVTRTPEEQVAAVTLKQSIALCLLS